MPTAYEDGRAAAAAALRLGTMSLGDSTERKDNETEPTAKNGTPTKLCSACGDKSNALKKCNGCKCVWYCDKKCQNKHRKEHKIECRRIKKELDRRGGKLDLGSELDVGPLEKVPPREECPICMHVLPIHQNLHCYAACCGKTICCACDYQHLIKNGKQAGTCAFCRATPPMSDEELLARLSKRVELKDPRALVNMALHYGLGLHGLSVDQTKLIDLLHDAADLGFPGAHYQLGWFHLNGEMGLGQNEEEALKHWEKAAEGGNIFAQHSLGDMEASNGDGVATMRHWRLSASGGYKSSMKGIIMCFEGGSLKHSDLAETLQAFYRSRAEMKSEGRDQYIKHLKFTGKYEEEFNLHEVYSQL